MSIAQSGFIEYLAPDGATWRVERGEALCADYGLEGSEAERLAALRDWHGSLSGQGRHWTLVRRIYAVAALLGCEDPDDLRAWSAEELAPKLGLTVADINAQLTETRVAWRRWQIENRRREVAAPQDQLAEAPLGEDRVKDLLKQYGFAEVEDPDERLFVAKRIEELTVVLENPHNRQTARSLIAQEVNLFFVIDMAIRTVRGALKRKRENEHDATKENKDLMALIDSRKKAQESLESTRESLGITESQTNRMQTRVNVQDTVSTLVQAVQEYHADGSRALIDGVFTAAEVEILTTPYTLRPAQYRPDFVAAVNESIGHLFDPDFTPTAMNRRAVRRLRAGFKAGLAEARAEAGEAIEDLDGESSREEAADEEADAGQARGLASPGLEIAAAASRPAATAATRPAPARGGNALSAF